MKIVSTMLLLLAASAAPALAAAPTWDASGDSQLNGTYYFRQVLYVADAGGNTSRAVTLFGNIAFSGSAPGTYTLSGVTMQDSGGGYNISATGNYSVSASGYGFLTDPLLSGTNVIFMVSNHILVGSATESGNNEMFVAAPYASSLSNASLTGTYTLSGFTVAPLTASFTTQLSPNGGSLGNVSISGTNGAGAVSQNSSNVKYNFVNGAAVITFPTNNNANFYSGQVYMYVSPDANFVFGGSPLGYDMFVGVRNASSGANTPISGLYYEAGLDENTTTGMDTYYGTFNAFNTSIIGHERIVYSNSGSASAEGYTYYGSYPATITNTYQDSSGSTNYTVGQNGIRIGAGAGQYLSISVGLPYTPPAPSSGVYVDPTGIVNSASSAPYTAGVSPGDFITLYNGVNLAGSTVFAAPGAFPNTLGGVKVLIDGIPAPLYYVSSTQISALVPYAVSTYAIATIQVNNNGTFSNTVTMYVNQTTPGVFTSNPVGGIGVAALLDFPAAGGYYIVSADKPAGPGDNAALYLTGLGNPFPPNPDGALGGTSCVSGSCLVNDVAVDIGGVDVGTPAFAGLAPDLAGLYQINFQIPPICATSTSTGCLTAAGTYTLGVLGKVAVSGGFVYDSYSNESVIPVGSGGAAAVRPANQVVTAKAPGPIRRALPRLQHPATR